MIGGPTNEASVKSPTIISPTTASLFLRSRRHASRHKDVPRTNSRRSAECTSASATANSGAVWTMSPARGRSGSRGAVPKEVSAGSTVSVVLGLSSRSSIVLIPDSWIEKTVRDIHQQIHHQQSHSYEGHDSEDQRFVAIQRRLNKIVPQTRQREDPLDHHRAGEDECQCRSSE